MVNLVDQEMKSSLLVGNHPHRPARGRGPKSAPRRPDRDRQRGLPHSGRAGARSRAVGLDRGSATGMRLKLDINPDIVTMMAAEVVAGEKAVTATIREAGTGLKTAAWRGQISGAGLGRRLANSIRSQNFPRSGESLNVAALAWSKAPVIVGAHDTGPLIRAKNGFWLAIPAAAAGRGLRGGRITPGEWERRRGLRLRFVYRRSGPSLLVADGRLNSRGLTLTERSRAYNCADLPASAAGEAAEAVRPRAGCGARSGRCARADRGELGAGKAVMNSVVAAQTGPSRTA